MERSIEFGVGIDATKPRDAIACAYCSETLPKFITGGLGAEAHQQQRPSRTAIEQATTDLPCSLM